MSATDEKLQALRELQSSKSSTIKKVFGGVLAGALSFIPPFGTYVAYKMYTSMKGKGYPELDFETKEKIIKELDPVFGISLPKESLGAFESYSKDRLSSLDGFSDTKVGGQAIPDMLSDAAQKNQAEEAIKHIFQLTPETGVALDTYQKDLNALNEVLKNPKQKHHPGAVLSYMNKTVEAGLAAMSAQHKKEIEAFEKEFQRTPDADGTLTAVFKQAGKEAELGSIQKEMRKALDKSHEDQRKKFNETAKEPLKKMHREIEMRVHNEIYLNGLLRSREMKALIEQAYKKKMEEQNQSGIIVDLNGDDETAMIKNLKIEDLPELRTLASRKIEVRKEGDSNHLSIRFPLKLFNPRYWNGKDGRLQADLMSLAMAIRAQGCGKIKMNVTHTDENMAMIAGRAAYAASLEAGFSDAEITVRVNGKVMKKDELYAGHENELQVAQSRAKEAKSLTENLMSKATSEDHDNLKSAIGGLRPARQSNNNAEPSFSLAQQSSS